MCALFLMLSFLFHTVAIATIYGFCNNILELLSLFLLPYPQAAEVCEQRTIEKPLLSRKGSCYTTCHLFSIHVVKSIDRLDKGERGEKQKRENKKNCSGFEGMVLKQMRKNTPGRRDNQCCSFHFSKSPEFSSPFLSLHAHISAFYFYRKRSRSIHTLM